MAADRQEGVAASERWTWICRGEHSDGRPRQIPMGEDCPGCGAGELDPQMLRCGSCGYETTPEEMHAHIQTCDGWETYEGNDLADLAREAGFDVVHHRPSWFERVILRRKGTL